MPFSLVSTITLWTLALWLSGWLALPVARRIFVNLPDFGLSAGRLTLVVLVALLAFWGAAAHAVPLKIAPALAILVALGCANGWRTSSTRDWARKNWRALAFSDAIFLACFAAFGWIRLQHPELNDLEKPMDIALFSAAWKTEWLPFAHPWWGGAHFTNYYYFGPFMGALMARALGAAPHVAYNLVQPAFCAFFLSIMWALGAALTRSKWWGVAVMLLVGLGGPLEPLRQISQKGWSWPLDWWTTSRVIPNTINEYPGFTMAIGDAHAHFYALGLAALWLCLAWSLFAPGQPESPATRRIIVGIGGLILGAWLMTNTWDAPIFGLLFGVSIWQTRAKNQSKMRSIAVVIAPFVIAIMAAALYFWKFKSPVGGVQFDAWVPDILSFALLWGGWIVLGALAGLLPAPPDDASARFRRLLIGAGLLALFAPYLFYLRGAFGDGDFRHQDTVFKFGSQAWLLLGTAISAELGARYRALLRAPKFVVALVLILIAPVLALASATTIWTRAVTQNTSQVLGVSLDGMRYLPQAQQRAIEWLQRNGRAGEIVMEDVQLNEQGLPTGDYDGNWGYVGAFSGLSSTLGWPQHVWGWDGNYPQVMERGQFVASLYRLPSAIKTAQGAAELNARYTFFGRSSASESAWQTPPLDEARAAGFSVHEFAGEDGSSALILERIGR